MAGIHRPPANPLLRIPDDGHPDEAWMNDLMCISDHRQLVSEQLAAAIAAGTASFVCNLCGQPSSPHIVRDAVIGADPSGEGRADAGPTRMPRQTASA